MKDLFYNPIFQGVRRTFALLVCMLFVFVFVVSPIKVKAEAFPVPPLWLPMNPYNAQGLEGNYVLLNDDQKKIVKEIIGAVNIVNLGFGQYILMNPITGVQKTREFLQQYGSTFLNTFWQQIMGTSRAMTDFVGSTIYKASTYNTYEEYEQDTAPTVSSGSQKYFQISPELTVAFKNWYRVNGGVEDWQFQVKPFSSNTPYLVHDNISGTVMSTYNSYLNNMSEPHVRKNFGSSSSTKNVVLNGDVFNTYCNLFLNTSGYFILMDNNGNTIDSGSHYGDQVDIYKYGSSVYAEHSTANVLEGYPYMTFNLNNYNSYVEAVRAFYNHSISFTSNIYYGVIFWEDFIKHVYVGANWSSKQEIFNIDDLNIGSSSSEYIDNITDTGYVDINTLIGQIADEVVNLRDVVNDSVLVKDGDSAIPYADSLTIAIDKYINQPESGVIIPVDIFGGLTGANGPVSYLWYMTKPLVSYTGDLLGILTLDGDGTFQFTGLGYIVVGVVTVGIIGGLVTKCLL